MFNQRMRIAMITAAALTATPVVAAPQEWFLINPRTSDCGKSPITPRQFDSEARTEGQSIDTHIVRNPDGSLAGVESKYKFGGEDMTLWFWPSMASCRLALQNLIDKGLILPPDMK